MRMKKFHPKFLHYILFLYTTVNICIGKTGICRNLFRSDRFFLNWPNFGEEVAEKLCKDLATLFAL
jgi:hypothetical protein